jgi:hypothetical protein
MKKVVQQLQLEARLNPVKVSQARCRLKTILARCQLACANNPSYSGGRDQEDHGSKPAWGNSSQDPI